MHIKDVTVTNPKNVVVQIPGFISSKWSLGKNDSLGVYYDEETGAVTIRPTKVRTRSNSNSQG